jgi:hypothetical protein
MMMMPSLASVHLDEKLIQRLLTLVIATAKTSAAVTADSIDLIDEDDARRILLCLIKHIAHTRCADADEHLDEVRARDGEERHIGFARNSARDQCLTRARRADKQAAARNASTEALKLLRIAQELDDLLQILLGLIDASDILERNAPVRLCQKLCLGLADTHRAPGPTLHLARQENPSADKDQDRKPVDEQRHEPGRVVGRRPRGDLHTLLLQLRDEARVERSICGEGAATRISTTDLVTRNHDGRDAACVGFIEKLAVGDLAAA